MTSSTNSALQVNTPSIYKKWGYTEQTIEKDSYMWTIKNFKWCFLQNTTVLYSPVFSVGANKTLIKLCIYSGGVENRLLNLLFGLTLTEEKKLKAKFVAKCTLCVVNSAKEKTVFEKVITFGSGDSTLKLGCIALDLLTNNRLPEDKVIIYCEIIALGSCIIMSGESNIEVTKCKLSEDLGKLLDDEKFTDVTLVADGHKFQAHKSILAARSAVFAAMFSHDFEELKLNCVDITDIHHATLREMLHFIYTGKVPNLNEMAKDLIIAADKYDLGDLKVVCENELSGKLSVETAAETLILADNLNAEQLRKYTFNFINAHATAVIRTPEWQKMIKTHAHLIAEAFQSFASNLER